MRPSPSSNTDVPVQTGKSIALGYTFATARGFSMDGTDPEQWFMLPQFVTPQWPANITPALQKRKLPGLLCVAKEHCPSSLTMPSGSRNLMLLSQQGVFWIVRLLLQEPALPNTIISGWPFSNPLLLAPPLPAPTTAGTQPAPALLDRLPARESDVDVGAPLAARSPAAALRLAGRSALSEFLATGHSDAACRWV